MLQRVTGCDDGSVKDKVRQTNNAFSLSSFRRMCFTLLACVLMSDALPDIAVASSSEPYKTH